MYSPLNIDFCASFVLDYINTNINSVTTVNIPRSEALDEQFIQG